MTAEHTVRSFEQRMEQLEKVILEMVELTQTQFADAMRAIAAGNTRFSAGINAIDTYGEYSRQSSAALSGQDPMRIDRIGVYAARYTAKNLVAAELADECEMHLSYSSGRSRPVSVQVESFNTGKLSGEDLAALLERHFNFRPAAIMKVFNLRRLPA